MKNFIKNKLNEELTKKDVKGEISVYIDSKTFEDKISKIIKDRIKKDREIEDKIVEITKDVIANLYKTLWIKKNTWSSNI